MESCKIYEIVLRFIPEVETYYDDITLEFGRRIAVPLGKSDKENKFRIENNFGKFTDVQIYANKEVP